MEQDERHVIDRSRGRGARADVHDDVAEFEELVRRHRLGEEVRRIVVGLDKWDHELVRLRRLICLDRAWNSGLYERSCAPLLSVEVLVGPDT